VGRKQLYTSLVGPRGRSRGRSTLGSEINELTIASFPSLSFLSFLPARPSPLHLSHLPRRCQMLDPMRRQPLGTMHVGTRLRRRSKTHRLPGPSGGSWTEEEEREGKGEGESHRSQPRDGDAYRRSLQWRASRACEYPLASL